MKKIILICIFLFCCSRVTFAENIIIKWKPNTETDLAGYKLYYGSETENYTTSVDVGNMTSYALLDYDGNFYCVLTAYDTSGNESEYSNEAHYILPVLDIEAPVNPHTPIIIIISQ